MTRDSLAVRRSFGALPLRAASHNDHPAAKQTEQIGQVEQVVQADNAVQTEQVEQAVRSGNPIAEILWPNLPLFAAWPFYRWRLHGLATRPERGLPASMLPSIPYK
jgi:hypothetical protein